MEKANETIGENIEKEILSQEDQISKHGGLNVNLEDFITRNGVKNSSANSEEEVSNENSIYVDDTINNFTNSSIDQVILEDTDNRSTTNESYSSTKYTKISSNNDTSIVSSNDKNLSNVSQSRILDETTEKEDDVSFANNSNGLENIEEKENQEESTVEPEENINITNATDEKSVSQGESTSQDNSNTSVVLTDIKSDNTTEISEEDDGTQQEDTTEISEEDDGTGQEDTTEISEEDDGTGQEDTTEITEEIYTLNDNDILDIDNISDQDITIINEDESIGITIDDVVDTSHKDVISNFTDENMPIDNHSNNTHNHHGNNHHNNGSGHHFVGKDTFDCLEEMNRLMEHHIHHD